MPRTFSDGERAAVRERLLQVAAEAVARAGLRRTTVAALCRAAGIAKGSFYGFFPSKEALLTATLRRSDAQLRARLERLAERPGSPDEVVARILALRFEALSGHPLRRALADPVEAEALARALPRDVLGSARGDDERWFTELVTALADRGVLRPEAAATLEALPRLLFAVVQGRRWIGEEPFEGVTEALIEALAAHLAREAGATGSLEGPAAPA